jgi:cephalosporin hydroxylase
VRSNFEEEKTGYIDKLRKNATLKTQSIKWIEEASRYKYSYLFSWLGRPIIQFPQDMIAMQEIIWNIKPDLIIETGIAHGGSLIYYASLLELIGNNGKVLGIDIEIRKHNRIEIEKHLMSKRIIMIEGSSIDRTIVERVFDISQGRSEILLILDSNHTHDHVYKELELYSSLVQEGSYIVVFDTIIEFLPRNFFPDRPWCKGNNPHSAVQKFLTTSDRFVVDAELEAKLLITVAPGGYLKCIKNMKG